MNPYEVLECSSDADQATLRDAYRRLVRLHHPDLAQEGADRELAHAKMQQINQAWQLLGDPKKRAQYDFERVSSIGKETRTTQATSPTPRSKTRTHSKSKTGKSTSSKTTKKTQSKVTAVSPTVRKVQKLKQVRSPEEIRLRNRQKLAEADSLRKHGRIVEAIALCQSVLRHDYRNIPAREMLADIYVAGGQFKKSLLLLDQAVALNGSNVDLKRRIAEIQAMQPKTESPKPVENAIPKHSAEPSLFFREETFQGGHNTGGYLQDRGLLSRLRDKLGNRR